MKGGLTNGCTPHYISANVLEGLGGAVQLVPPQLRVMGGVPFVGASVKSEHKFGVADHLIRCENPGSGNDGLMHLTHFCDIAGNAKVRKVVGTLRFVRPGAENCSKDPARSDCQAPVA